MKDRLAPARHRVGGYSEFAPPPETALFCEAYWMHRTSDGPVVPGGAHRVLPDVAVSLAFQVFRDDQGRPVDGGPLLIGPKLRPQIYNIIPGRELAAIRFKPEWVAPVLGVDPLDTEDQIIDLEATHPAAGARLRELLWRTRSAREAIDVLARFVIDSRASRLSPPPNAVAALEMVRRTAGRLPCEHVAGRLGLSARHLRRQVIGAMGFSPKAYARVVRFVSTMLMADASEHPAWADLAVRAGYCDQSHLIRDAVAMTGTSPAELFLERRRQTLGAAVSERSNT
jgi:AraC-like DNA-binding protein